jgi:hypothetical protein
LTTGDSRSAFTIVKELVHDHSTTKSQKAKFHTTDIQQLRMCLIDDVQVIHFVFVGTKLFQNLHILTSPPHGVDGNIKSVSLIEEEG